MRKTSFQILFASLLVAMFWSCQSEYAKLEKAELAKGIRKDSLFFDIRLGQSKRDFYEICWEKNRQGLFSAGGPNNFVRYEISGDTTSANDISMFFYPDFDDDDNIIGMDMEYKYKAWAPWNEQLQANELVPALKDTLMSWYKGNDFIEIPDEEETETVWVKVDGNRRIALKIKNDEAIQVKIVDLTVEE